MEFEREAYHYEQFMLWVKLPLPQLWKILLSVLALLFASRLYCASRVEVSVCNKLAAVRLATWRTAASELVRCRAFYLAVASMVVKAYFWNKGIVAEQRYALFKTPMRFRAERPTSPENCFMDDGAQVRQFEMFEATQCSRIWRADALWGVGYVPAVYSPQHDKYSCLHSLGGRKFGNISVDAGEYDGPGNAYVHDMARLKLGCEAANVNCSTIEQVRTDGDGNTWIMSHSPTQRIRLVMVRDRPGLTVLREVFHAIQQGRSEREAVRIGLSIHQALNKATCFDEQRYVPVGRPQSHLRVDLHALFWLLLVECVLWHSPSMHDRRQPCGAERSSCGDLLPALLDF